MKKRTKGATESTSAMYLWISRLLMHPAQMPGASTHRTRKRRRKFQVDPAYSRVSTRIFPEPGAPPQIGHSGFGGAATGVGAAGGAGAVTGASLTRLAPSAR